jgi:hypothetical protein
MRRRAPRAVSSSRSYMTWTRSHFHFLLRVLVVKVHTSPWGISCFLKKNTANAP